MSRPEVLYPLFADLTRLTGIGPKTARSLEQIGVTHPRDVLLTLPYAGIDRQLRTSVLDVALPTTLTVAAKIGPHRPPTNKGGAYRVHAEDAKTAFQIVYFHARADYLRRILPEGSRRILSGKVELFDSIAQMVHPEHVVEETAASDIPTFEPIYPLTAGVTQKTMFKATRSALQMVPDLVEWIDPAQKDQADWPSFSEALQRAHSPTTQDDLATTASARERLAYDELMAHQLTLALARAHVRGGTGMRTEGDGHFRERVIANLPYKPTRAQNRAIDEIAEDMASPQKMNRLLQGDVGSGKTLVALLAMLIAVEAGGQAVMMAPTETLARQHLEGLQPLAMDAGVCLDLLTGRDKGQERRRKLDALERGEIDVLVGTHAVFQSDVAFADLRLAIVDEQHRFGVRQRLALGEKGRRADVLVMTATPIPRSLALAQYGDMDVSVLDEKPPGRKPIRTALVSSERIEEVLERLRVNIADDRQCYWVCPLVEESEVVDLTAAEERYKRLRAALGAHNVGLVHGQMAPGEKDAAMARFQAGDTKILVATTVIEVGVNVPNATIMVVERAERFGLAQLHQLRGRVGRGEMASTCLLMYQAPLSERGRQRLEVLRETEDGFVIAETDLRMRGYGDLIGTAQSGVPRFRVADIERQSALMAIAQSDARRLLADDPSLKSARGQAARILLWLMRQPVLLRI
ncbi:MAG: ATP-dependent DNA helicase RecG [Pseudomonadota bacterium]